ncbi:4Fe-4S dicluster domain-containing protein [candidate division TA06 bacterium]|uniref:4Fe-4S dicluster domain-containing protein n=1 Tax=candidate division TA06 bacterium TaxID=2250710 RepID=A0A523XIY3_UNCT6|nr:MAG: 4Fe-4S dicluster domain-containing protein [candidate division TA06 bacterium]
MVAEGMEVKTDSEKAMNARKVTVELLLARVPGSEVIQDLAKKVGIEAPRFKTKDEEEKCVLCGLCVRVCNEVMRVGAIGFANRGAKMEVTPPYKEFSKVCTTCGACAYSCPTGAITVEEISERTVNPLLSEFNEGLETRPCIYIPFPQAVPNTPVIDRENCMYFKTGNCKVCETVCQPKAIVYDEEDTIVEEDVGAIVVATGYDVMNKEVIEEYNYDSCPDVITGLQFERLLSASGPTGGEVRRPSDGKVPKEVVFVQCAGSREPERYQPYCSKICCMYTVKHAMLYKHRVHDGQPYIFYIDIRSGGKGYEEFVQRATDEDGVLYFRGKVSKIFQEDGRVVVWGADTLTGKKIEIYADMVVLATAILPSVGAGELAKKLKISTDEHGFLSEAHPKLRPVESLTTGIYLAGTAQAPRDIPETVAQASGAAAKVISLFSSDELEHDPTVSEVDEELCAGCGYCVNACAYDAIQLDPKRNVAVVNEVLCEGCGGCAATCPSGAIQHRNFTRKQVLDMVHVATEDF